MRISIPGVPTLACATLVRTVSIPLVTLGRVVGVLATRLMLGAKLTELETVIVARRSFVRISSLIALFAKSWFLGDRLFWPTHLGLFLN